MPKPASRPPIRAFRFQYKGLYPALEEASRVSPSFRAKLEHLVDEVECSVCGGSRLRDDAAAVRLRGRTIDELCRLPLGRLLEEFRSWKPRPAERKIAGEVTREIHNRLQFLVDVGLDYLTLARPAPRFPAARCSASAWRPKWAAACAACSTCSTSRPSACTLATTAACLVR